MPKRVHKVRMSELMFSGAGLALVVGLFAIDHQWSAVKVCAAAAFFVLNIAGLIRRAIERDRGTESTANE